jgi:hypothetical protein
VGLKEGFNVGLSVGLGVGTFVGLRGIVVGDEVGGVGAVGQTESSST